jgi:hypothetical protein
VFKEISINIGATELELLELELELALLELLELLLTALLDD